MADINDIKEAVMTSFGAVAGKTIEYAGKTKEYAEKASIAAKGVATLAKLNMELNSERENINKAYTEIGKLYYQLHKDEPEGFFVQLCDEISLATANADNLQEQIEMIKSSLNMKQSENEEDDDFVIELETIPEDNKQSEDVSIEEPCDVEDTCFENSSSSQEEKTDAENGAE